MVEEFLAVLRILRGLCKRDHLAVAVDVPLSPRGPLHHRACRCAVVRLHLFLSFGAHRSGKAIERGWVLAQLRRQEPPHHPARNHAHHGPDRRCRCAAGPYHWRPRAAPLLWVAAGWRRPPSGGPTAAKGARGAGRRGPGRDVIPLDEGLAFTALTPGRRARGPGRPAVSKARSIVSCTHL